jgi:predicted negative regulator of RcsB-dependent stress response
MSSREIREKMEHDPLFDSISGVKHFWEKSGNAVTIALLVIVAGYVGFRLYSSSKQKHDESALMYFELAQQDYQASSSATEEEKKKKKLDDALNSLNVLGAEYEDTKAAVMGEILRANILMSQGEVGSAKEIYEALAAKEKEGDLYVLARLGIAQCLAVDESGLSAAIEEYRGLRKEFPQSPLIGQIDFELAGALDTAGQEAEALEIYKTFGDDSPWYNLVQDRIEYLETPVYLRSKTGA